MSDDDDRRVVKLDRDVAEELLDLVEDKPGEADEDLLDQALRAVREADHRLSGPEQKAIARGDAVAMAVEAEEAEVVTALVVDNTEKNKRRLHSFARSLRGKLKAARNKRKKRS